MAAKRRRSPVSILSLVRWWLPAIVVAAGIVAVAIDPTLQGLEGAAHIIGAGLAILLLNLLVRVGFSGDRDRDEEDAARAYFDQHGFWPDEAAAHGIAPSDPPPAPAAAPAIAHRTGPPRAHAARPRPRGSR